MADDDKLLSKTAIARRAKEAFKAYRINRKWAMREMAEFLGITAKNYEKYEGDAVRGVPADVIARFCKSTDTELDWIMFGKKSLRKAM